MIYKWCDKKKEIEKENGVENWEVLKNHNSVWFVWLDLTVKVILGGHNYLG